MYTTKYKYKMHNSYFSMKRTLLAALILLSCKVSSAQPGPGVAAINPPTGDFQIEGDLQANTPISGKGDWVPGPAGAGGSVLTAAGGAINSAITFHLRDVYGSASDNSFAGGLKFNDNPNN